jgi:(S)-2-hydroxyglutarate dehydrogenase
LSMGKSYDFDVIIIGAGVLGVTTAYWLSTLYDSTIAIADAAEFAGAHTTSRNTGVIHRPFYLDPAKKRIFARTSLLSHSMWRSLAEQAGLPWRPIGTFNVAVQEREIATLERYKAWGVKNGMGEDEMELLDGVGVRSLEPEVRCRAGLISKTDVSVDFGVFTRHLWRMLGSLGVKFLGGHKVTSVSEKGGFADATAKTRSGISTLRSKFLINAGGGGALEIAHSCGLAKGYASLNFRGEYWVVDEPFASKVTSNIYRPPQFPQYPFLDPHFVVRADGTRQIGPNAVIVPGPYVYSGIGLTQLGAFLSRPLAPKRRLLMNRDFLSLVAGEWRSSLSKRAMCGRVRRFVPALNANMLNGRAVFGVRSSVVDASGFVPEALLLRGEASAHIINFNSPGATGAPAYSAMVVENLRSWGYLESLKPKEARIGIPGWDFRAVTAGLQSYKSQE